MNNNPIKALPSLGQSIWYDNIQRSMLRSGELNRLIEEDDLRGVTTNPAIFQKAIAESNDYDDSLAHLCREFPGQSYEEHFVSLAVEDIQETADILRPVYDRTQGEDGMVSIEVSPLLAYDTDGSIAEGKELFARIGRPNVMIKIPATKAGIPAIEELIASGINVNATLLFSVERYVEVAEAYIRGIRKRYEKGADISRIASVASFFVSRVDAAVDKALAERTTTANNWERTKLDSLAGKVAIANAKVAYLRYQKLFSEASFGELHKAGALKQRLLWASTGSKNPQYSDVLYVQSLIGPDTVNTVPPATYEAFKDHGRAESTLLQGIDYAEDILNQVTGFDIDIDAVTKRLEEEGVAAFAKAYNELLAAIGEKGALLIRNKAS
ncbi:MAG TPA: transaldolase [Gammaproteobacteria bacterium]|nr:transaldolase [Gammaproteobacteria bacterium]